MDLLQKPQWDPITPTLLGGFTPIIPFLGLNINENSSIIGYIFHHSPYPIGSMYGIYANIGCILMVNVTIYTIHGSYGYEKNMLIHFDIPNDHDSWFNTHGQFFWWNKSSIRDASDFRTRGWDDFVGRPNRLLRTGDTTLPYWCYKVVPPKL